MQAICGGLSGKSANGRISSAFEGEDPIMVVARRLARRDGQAGEAVQERWGEAAIVFLNGKEPNWEEIERIGRERRESA
jgi:hypothetical protein